jgi:molybdopterin synthase sulfur carrier subunit
MKINILAFGIVSEIFGTNCINLQLPHNINITSLKQILNQKYPALLQLKSYMVAVNKEYAVTDLLISENDEIAIIPPVSGG